MRVTKVLLVGHTGGEHGRSCIETAMTSLSRHDLDLATAPPEFPGRTKCQRGKERGSSLFPSP